MSDATMMEVTRHYIVDPDGYVISYLTRGDDDGVPLKSDGSLISLIQNHSVSPTQLAHSIIKGGHYRNEDLICKRGLSSEVGDTIEQYLGEKVKDFFNSIKESYFTFKINDITQADYCQRVKDAFKIDAYHSLAFVGNTVRFVFYFFASIVATLCLVAVALKIAPANDGDYCRMYRRCARNLTFMGHNLAMILKHAVAAIPVVSHIAIAGYNKCHQE